MKQYCGRNTNKGGRVTEIFSESAFLGFKVIVTSFAIAYEKTDIEHRVKDHA